MSEPVHLWVSPTEGIQSAADDPTDSPGWEIYLAREGVGCRVLRDGQLVPNLYRVELAAEVSEPTTIRLFRFVDSARVEGPGGIVRIIHRCAHCQGHDPDDV